MTKENSMTQTAPVQPSTGNNLVLEDSIEIPAPINEVYRRWSDFPRFPDFMSNVEEVTPRGGNRYHWVARIFGIKQEWDAEVTDSEPNRRISWRSVTGAYNGGTVTFTDLGAGNTQVRVRFEYAPPGGKVGQALDQLTQTTRNEVHQDLVNFKNLYTGGATAQPSGLQAAARQAQTAVQGMAQQAQGQIAGAAQQLGQQAQGGIGSVLIPLAAPLSVAAAGGVASYVIGRRLRESAAYAVATSPVAFPNAVAGWALTGASGASILGSAALRSQGRPTDALFVGQWAPTFLQAGILARLLGHRGIYTDLPTSVASWACAAACAGSIVTSAILHLRGRREQGLFVGQWAPTLLGASVFTRLFNQIIGK
jgi:uncharacterized membrane protein